MKKPKLPIVRRLRRRVDGWPPWAPVALTIVVVLGLSALVVPTLSTSGRATDVTVEELGLGAEPAGTRTSGAVVADVNGYVVRAGGRGNVSIPLRFPAEDGERPVVRLWVYGTDAVESTVTVVASDGERKELGKAGYWAGEPFDLSDALTSGRARVEISVSSSGDQDALFFDQIAVAQFPEDAQPDSSTALVALWLVALIAALLLITGRLRRHWPLLPAVAFLVALSWPTVDDTALKPLEGATATLWQHVVEASTLSLHSGLVSGTFGEQSALATQLYHALTLLVGEGGSSPYAASILTAVLALCALYALGNRVAGRAGAVTVVLLCLLADGFRDAATSGAALPALILAAALFLYAVHLCLAEASRYALALLGGFGALMFLANSTWIFGIVLTILLVGVLYGRPDDRWRAVGVGLGVFLVLILPNRVSTADLNNGNLFADMTRRATLVRNVEFAGEGHGAPSEAVVAADPLAGRRVGLVPYLVDDHSVLAVAGGALTGAYDALEAFGRRDETRLAGLLGFLVGLVGMVYLLIVPRLRLLVLAPFMVAVPTLFFQSRGAGDAFANGAALWPAFVTGGGVLVYVAAKLVRERGGAAPATPGRPAGSPDGDSEAARDDAPSTEPVEAT